MHKKQDRILTILAADCDPLVDSANIDEPFFYDAIGSYNHQIISEPLLILFTRDKSVDYIEIHVPSLFLAIHVPVKIAGIFIFPVLLLA